MTNCGYRFRLIVSENMFGSLRTSLKLNSFASLKVVRVVKLSLSSGRLLSFTTQANELREAMIDAQELRFKAQHYGYKFVSEHSFSKSAAPILTDYCMDSQGNFKEETYLQKNDDDVYKFSVDFKTLFHRGFRLLDNFLQTDGKDQYFIGQLVGGELLALGSLISYLEALDFHRESLYSLVETENFTSKMSETEVAVIMAIHLFSQLCINTDTPSYIVSNEMPNKYRRCPCENQDCKQDVLYGNTFFGSDHLFYGYPDIVVFPKSAGSCSIVVPRVFKDEELMQEENFDQQAELQKRQNKLFRAKASQKQIASLAISFSFYQSIRQYRKRLQSPPRSSDPVLLIPTIAVSDECFDIYLYDTENDILMINEGEPIPLWNDAQSLSISSIVTLWIVLNHSLFRPRIPSGMKKIKGSCGLAEKLEMIEKTFQMSKARYRSLKIPNKMAAKAKEIRFDRINSDSDSD